jgi:hypothetical protein
MSPTRKGYLAHQAPSRSKARLTRLYTRNIVLIRQVMKLLLGIAMKTISDYLDHISPMALACVAHKSSRICERCRLWQRNFRLGGKIPLLLGREEVLGQFVLNDLF